MKFKDRFGPHFAIERFGVIFLVLVICMGALIGSIGHKKHLLSEYYKEGQALYTSSFVFSKTKASGNVKGIFVNPSKTKCLLMLKFADMNKLPIDANEYLCLLTGSTMNMYSEELKSNPNAMMYLFGSTGYAGIYFENAEPFPSQIMSVTLRSLNTFAGGEGYVQYDDASFKKFDQARIYFNPGAGNATKVNFLDMESWTIMDAYAELIAQTQEKSIRNSLRNTLGMIHQEYVKLNEYALRLENQGIVMSEYPAEIAGDELVAVDPKDETRTPLVWNIEAGMWYNVEGTLRYNTDGVWYYYKPHMILPGGYSFNWQDKHIEDGYMEELTGSDDAKIWMEYFTKHATEKSDAGNTFTTECEWYDKDGNLFDPVQIAGDVVANERKQVISNTIESIEQSWQHIYDLKCKYQYELLPSLLHVESDIRTIFQTYTVNYNEDGKFLMIY